MNGERSKFVFLNAASDELLHDFVGTSEYSCYAAVCKGFGDVVLPHVS
jgi:hypothetical protein